MQPGSRKQLSPHSLVAESNALEARMAVLQDESRELDLVELEELKADYFEWHAGARQVLEDADRKKFDAQRDGGWMPVGITHFLADPRKTSSLYQENQPTFVSKWQLDFSRVQPRLQAQRNLLLDVAHSEAEALSTALDLQLVFRRLPSVLRALERLDGVASAQRVKNEADLQAVVEALLRSLFDDVRPEEHSPSRAGANSRIDFVLPGSKLVIETKMTREGLSDRRVGEELLIDAGRYGKHPDCEAILAVVYDPSGRIRNPAGLEADLTADTGLGVPVRCVVI